MNHLTIVCDQLLLSLPKRIGGN